MAVKIKTVREATVDNGLKILVHGGAGAGKTVLCATSGEATLIISAESGLLSIKDAPDHIHVSEISSMAELEEMYEYLATADHGYKWVALDSISEMGELVLKEEKAAAKDARAAYGELMERMTDILKKFRDLPKINVIMTCKQKRFVDEDIGRTYFVPDLPGRNLTNSLPYVFDLVLAMRVEKDDEGKMYRVVQTQPDLNYVAKDRSGKLSVFEKPNLKALYAKVHAPRKEKTKTETKEK